MPETREQEFNPSEPGFIKGLHAHEVWQAILDYRRIYGFEEMRELVAECVNHAAGARYPQ